MADNSSNTNQDRLPRYTALLTAPPSGQSDDQSIKRIGLISDPDDRQGIIAWAKYNKAILSNTQNYATFGTGGELEREAGIPVQKEITIKLNQAYALTLRLRESTKGGDQQMGCLLVNQAIDYLIYFWDTQGKEPHDDDIKAMLRQSVHYDIPTACNRNTADHLISSPLFTGTPSEAAIARNPSEKVRIALVAHDGKKDKLVEWARSNVDFLRDHVLFATGTTGALISKHTGLDINRMKSGPYGGDTEIASLIIEKELDYLCFFWDPHTAQPHDVDVKALLRNAIHYNVATACNPSTASHLVTSTLFPRKASS
jgi:methylglyoxal synthase